MGRVTLLLVLMLIPSLSNAYQKGIALGLYSKDRNYSYRQELEEIHGTGADHVSLVVSWYQKDIRAIDIYPRQKPLGDFETTPDEVLEKVIQEAHRMGLKVFLFPILRIEERQEKDWRGVVEPSRLPIWLENYKRFTLHYARLAASQKVELYSVGSELCSIEKETQFWKQLISEIRVFYPGKLLYSANWDHYQKIRFWSDLDYLGLNGYYELTKDSTPNIEDLLKQWKEIEDKLSSWQKQNQKQIIFTELGYPSIDGACGKPWDYTRETAIDLQEQALCYEAFFLAWSNSSSLGGVYFWNWYGQGGTNDHSYTPRGKPAEKVLTRWYHF